MRNKIDIYVFINRSVRARSGSKRCLMYCRITIKHTKRLYIHIDRQNTIAITVKFSTLVVEFQRRLLQ